MRVTPYVTNFRHPRNASFHAHRAPEEFATGFATSPLWKEKSTEFAGDKMHLNANRYELEAGMSQIACFATGGDTTLYECLNLDPAKFFDDVAARLSPTAESLLLLANPVQPHSEGEIKLASSDPMAPPSIHMNYFGDPYDLKVMVAVIRRALDIAAHWPSKERLGPLMVPPHLALKHGYEEGTPPSDAMLEDVAVHFSGTVYHLCSTCRIGSVVDPQLRVTGVGKLRVADASVFPNIISGNTNAPAIMVGEKAAEMIASDHHVKLAEFVGRPQPVLA